MPPPNAKMAASTDLDDLVFTLVALLRAHGHLCNVLTHVASGNWRAVEQGITSILSPRTTPKRLSDVARNILQLICDGRGDTGPIMRSFVFDVIARVEGRSQMRRLEKKIGRLRRRISREAGPTPQAPRANGDPATNRPDVRGCGKTARRAVNIKLKDKHAPVEKTMLIAEFGRPAI